MMRRLRPDRNPLRRAADRAEPAVMAGLARRALDRRRLVTWEAEWSRTGPQWTGRA